jgi:YVTN family beta-propeller protein
MSTVRSARRPQTLLVVLATLIVALAAFAASASARDLYVASYGGDNVAVISSETGQQVAPLISTGAGSGPWTLAISPDGKTVYTANYSGDSVSVIDTQTKAVVGAPIPVGETAAGIAVTPDGSKLVVANASSDSVTILDTQSRATVATIPVGENPEGVAITPNGTRAFITNTADDTVSVIDLTTNQVVGLPIPVGETPYGVAVTPDGSRILVANVDSDTLSVIDAASATTIGSPIPMGERPSQIGITPDGQRAFIGNYKEGAVSIFDIPSSTRIGSIPVSEPEFVGITPDGKKAFTSAYDEGVVYAFDPVANSFLGGPFAVGGEAVGAIVAVPNQPPVAALSAPAARIRPGVPATLDASASHDPDGSVANYVWSFGDGTGNSGPSPQQAHVYSQPGAYTANVVLTDNEGCSISFVYTGKTAYCNGSGVAAVSVAVTVAYPGVSLKCPAAAKPGGCKYVIQGVRKVKKGKLKPTTGRARIKLKAGKSAIVSLKPKAAYATKLAGAQKIQARVKRTAKGKTRVSVRKLKVVQ